ncbi:tRNA (adenosine(37)-N6)-threonylcarbamoyltransferase complex ATPase subunit type 1 TsaE [Candidatus Uhrbacteria bacterium]|nr:tRNA (adenosine(37)-N6)-threonylcarbamoyltransferase complex ATPase subunit type 1 TsaE [Candidatus Uhrbacteria bacterium]
MECVDHKNMKTLKHEIKSLEDWQKVIKTLLPHLKYGTILALSGPLGAGKTTFVQLLAKALGAKVNPRSPTFSLVRNYSLLTTNYLLKRLVHVDAYRIEDEKDLLPLNLDEELAEPGTIMAIEWPENIKKWLTHQRTPIIHIDISLQKTRRQVQISAEAGV